jgi:hypothetical protein
MSDTEPYDDATNDDEYQDDDSEWNSDVVNDYDDSRFRFFEVGREYSADGDNDDNDGDRDQYESDNDDYENTDDVFDENNPPPFTQIAKLSGDMKTSLAVLVESGICKVTASASLVVMPSAPDYSTGSSSNLDPLPPSAREIYFGQSGGQQRSQQQQPGQTPGLSSSQQKDFFQDNWYFVELHQSILQESTQPQ